MLQASRALREYSTPNNGRFFVGFEVLVASVTPQSGVSRGVGADNFQIMGPDFSVTIASPRRGFATIALLAPGQCEVYPGPGQEAITITPPQPRDYGPLPRPRVKTTMLVIVTETPAAETIRKALPVEGAAPEDISKILENLNIALLQHGYRWAAIARMTIEPPTKD
jgi:hypothetical protein